MSIMGMRRQTQEILGLDHFQEISAKTYAALLSMDFQGQVLAEIEKRHMKLKDLAKKMGLTASALNHRLNSSNLTLKTIAEFALALDMEVDTPELLTEEQVNAALER